MAVHVAWSLAFVPVSSWGQASVAQASVAQASGVHECRGPALDMALPSRRLLKRFRNADLLQEHSQANSENSSFVFVLWAVAASLKIALSMCGIPYDSF